MIPPRFAPIGRKSLRPHSDIRLVQRSGRTSLRRRLVRQFWRARPAFVVPGLPTRGSFRMPRRARASLSLVSDPGGRGGDAVAWGEGTRLSWARAVAPAGRRVERTAQGRRRSEGRRASEERRAPTRHFSFQVLGGLPCAIAN